MSAPPPSYPSAYPYNPYAQWTPEQMQQWQAYYGSLSQMPPAPGMTLLLMTSGTTHETCHGQATPCTSTKSLARLSQGLCAKSIWNMSYFRETQGRRRITIAHQGFTSKRCHLEHRLVVHAFTRVGWLQAHTPDRVVLLPRSRKKRPNSNVLLLFLPHSLYSLTLLANRPFLPVHHLPFPSIGYHPSLNPLSWPWVNPNLLNNSRYNHVWVGLPKTLPNKIYALLVLKDFRIAHKKNLGSARAQWHRLRPRAPRFWLQAQKETQTWSIGMKIQSLGHALRWRNRTCASRLQSILRPCVHSRSCIKH